MGEERYSFEQVVALLPEGWQSPSAALDEFAAPWDARYPMIVKSWRSRWAEVIPFFKFSPDIRKAVYTT